MATDTKVLGMHWNTEEDTLKLSLTSTLNFLKTKLSTKRYVLQAANRIYDIMGLLSPFTIRVKIMFQKLWELKIGWDNSLPENIQQEWNTWCNEIPQLQVISISRFLFEELRDTTLFYELHVFTDASPKAYGAVVYLRTSDSENTVEIHLLLAKARVAPLKKLTLPRLELMGALIGSRLLRYVEKTLSLQDHEVFLWTDSTITWKWIQGQSHRWEAYVANRVREIQNNTPTARWRFCPGKKNPADCLTRGLSASNLESNNLWWTGPSWLKKPSPEWPQAHPERDDLDDMEDNDIKTNVVQVTTAVDNPVLDLQRYSELSRVLRVTAWIYCFKENTGAMKELSNYLLTAELKRAEQYWIKVTQKNEFSGELQSIQNGRPLSK
ncbi:uncharacterized protein LOC120849489 [Ixodes scapularis]|uniref:uncharacterized protein LOC120849489 n=1 Tax=Ixodes scapularis TaxID=6945 RepID=UPI001A9E0E5E|nr:uncharacterized protein LOC120849489 [Ixodes scapularis]